MPNKTIIVQVPSELHAAIHVAAHESYTTASAWLRHVIGEALNGGSISDDLKARARLDVLEALYQSALLFVGVEEMRRRAVSRELIADAQRRYEPTLKKFRDAVLTVQKSDSVRGLPTQAERRAAEDALGGLDAAAVLAAMQFPDDESDL